MPSPFWNAFKHLPKTGSVSFFSNIATTIGSTFRQRKLEEKLGQARSLGEWLRGNPRGANYEIPIQVRAVVPIVVSPFVEYLWSRDRDLWRQGTFLAFCHSTKWSDCFGAGSPRESLLPTLRPFIFRAERSSLPRTRRTRCLFDEPTVRVWRKGFAGRRQVVGGGISANAALDA